MKSIFAAAAICCLPTFAFAQYGSYGSGSNPNDHMTSGYTRSGGQYVAPHYQTNPNNTTLDNYGTRGNYNPHNGEYGRRGPY